MSHLLLYYQRPEPATWVFLSSFLLLGIYFVFHRFFSVRNLDIALLVLLSPGLMMVYEGRRLQIASEDVVALDTLAGEQGKDGPVHLVAYQSDATQTNAPSESSQNPSPDARDQGVGAPQVANNGNETTPPSDVDPASGYQDPSATDEEWSASDIEYGGFIALLIGCCLLMVRMLVDPALVRRPLLMPNLSIGGLSFIGLSLFLFLMANVITSTPLDQAEHGPKLGPGYPLLNMLPALPTVPEGQANDWQQSATAPPAPWLPNLARVMAILSNLAIVTGIVGVGYWHFDNVKTGIGCAVMYLLLPYTAQMTGNLEHAMPAALLVLALLAYRQPLISGVLLGLAAGLVYYPLFLLPLWISFYWNRGLGRLLTGVALGLFVLSGLLLLEGFEAFGEHLKQMFGLWRPRMEGLEGIWAEGRVPAEFRLPVLVGCILLSASFVFWPSRKNLGSLMCGTSAIMLAVQFWHGFGGGLFMAWFLPFALLTIFRPNLDDRIAINVIRPSGAATPPSTIQSAAA